MDCIIKTSPTHLRNPNDPARFIGKVAATEDGEAAKIHNYLDTEKIEQEALYDDKTGFSSRRYTHKSPFPYLFPCISDISFPLERDLENAFSCETILDK